MLCYHDPWCITSFSSYSDFKYLNIYLGMTRCDLKCTYAVRIQFNIKIKDILAKGKLLFSLFACLFVCFCFSVFVFVLFFNFVVRVLLMISIGKLR